MKTFVSFLTAILFFLLIAHGTTAQTVTTCQSDADCAEDSEYCSGGQCRQFGGCGSLTDCLNPSNIYPSPACVGYLYCDQEEGGLCRTNCTGSFCPPGVESAGCFGSQCSLSGCEEDYVSCVDYSCGICEAIFFDAAGNQICDQTVAEEGPTACTINKDCGFNEYCSSNECRSFGTCGSFVDCLNPSNIYSLSDCNGYLYCDEGAGLCSKNCNGSFCPPNLEPVSCDDPPCSVSLCDEASVSCANYLCGSCSAIFFDAAGYQVCRGDESTETSPTDESPTEPTETPPTDESPTEPTETPPTDESPTEPTETPPADESPTEPTETPPTDASSSVCNSDDDCGDNEYCSSNECREFGTCTTRLDCLNPSNIYAVIDCVGPLDCDEATGTCGRQCTGFFCPDEDDVECDVPPCSEAACDEAFVSCIDYNCGGCSAIFLDAAGNQVCTETPPTDASSSVCNSDDDCGDSEYCSSNECREFGTCTTRLDCLNPSNIYAVIECVGPLDCDEATGTCGRQCTGFFCPDEDDVECDVPPCSEAACDEAFVSCIDDNCGGCSAIFLDAAGNPVCQATPTTPIPEQTPASACSVDGDCTESEYCSAGICREKGSCSVLEDCFNPSNIYADVQCVGFVYCDEATSTCGRQCTGSFCPPDSEEVTCEVSPCNVTECNEDYVSCVDYTCDNCTAIFFDAAGNRVCQDAFATPVPEQTAGSACSMNDDCTESEYCSAGICREMGGCGVLEDCFNPSNMYPTVLCVGFVYCDEATSTCGIECGESFCPPGTEEVTCEVSPCNVTDCNEDYVSCFDYTCDNCTAIFFDAAGNRVCQDTSAPSEPEQASNFAACSVDDDCADSEYCSAGSCREYGFCSTVLDCQNPANLYPDPKCAGYLYCDDTTGRCGRNCTGTCADGTQPVNCFDQPCSATTCDVPFVSCADDYCGGCNAIFFDAAGNQVCKPEVMEPEPSATQGNATSVQDETSGVNSHLPLIMLLSGFISALVLFVG